ncbi:MAG: hypothetical protein KGS09_20110 [Nitrospirae bacterium]|nr:hypothetical protein [Nitrospirota bacterium]
MTDVKHKHDSTAVLLQDFPAKHVKALLRHFSDSMKAFESGSWESCILKAGKFIEAVIKALAQYAKIELGNPRQFKVGNFTNKLGQLDASQFDDSIRLLIPRNCIFVYDIASNRGSRHDPTDIDPNKMDAIVVAQNIAWILAEMIRLSHKGALNPDNAANAVEGLMEKQYPDIEDIDGRLYVNREGLSATEIALLLLERRYPHRFNRNDLIATLVRNNFKEANARVAVSRVLKYVDDDGNGNLKLRTNGKIQVITIRSRNSA